MNYKPNNKLPAPLYRLLTEPYTPKPGRYGVNSLVGPPRIRQLRQRHDHEMTADATDNVWLLFGKLLHHQMEAAAGPNALSEEKLTIDRNGHLVVGVPDLYVEARGGVISDYKFCSVYSAKDGIRFDWEAQLNIYKLLVEHVGFSVKHLEVVAIYRDWSQTRSDLDTEYPARVEVLPVRLWSETEAWQYLDERLNLHIVNELVPNDKLTECTDAERWASPQVFAVMKPGGKRSLKNHDSMAAAEADAKERGEKHFVEIRPLEYRRCHKCECRFWCNQVSEGKTVDQKISEAGL